MSSSEWWWETKDNMKKILQWMPEKVMWYLLAKQNDNHHFVGTHIHIRTKSKNILANEPHLGDGSTVSQGQRTMKGVHCGVMSHRGKRGYSKK